MKREASKSDFGSLAPSTSWRNRPNPKPHTLGNSGMLYSVLLLREGTGPLSVRVLRGFGLQGFRALVRTRIDSMLV